jgi:hypothetical protein
METQQSDASDPIAREIKELEEKQAKLGEEGNVDEYMKVGTQIEQLKARKSTQQKPAQMAVPEGEAGDVIAALGGGPQQQSLKVCEVCALYLSAKDTAKRLEDHYIGKLHTGFHIVRQKLEELKARPNRRVRPDHEEGGRGDRGSYLNSSSSVVTNHQKLMLYFLPIQTGVVEVRDEVEDTDETMIETTDTMVAAVVVMIATGAVIAITIAVTHTVAVAMVVVADVLRIAETITAIVMEEAVVEDTATDEITETEIAMAADATTAIIIAEMTEIGTYLASHLRKFHP